MNDPLTSKRMVVVIGAQKAGTSWLYDQLKRSDEAFFSPLKELHYFDAFHGAGMFTKFSREMEKRLQRLVGSGGGADPELVACLEDRVRMTADMDSYLDFFRTRVSEMHSVFGEVTPSYAALGPDGFAALRRCHSDVRIIFVMREPVDRLMSAMNHYARRHGRAATSDEVIGALTSPGILARCRYDTTLRNLDDHFCRPDVLTVFYEDMFMPEFSRTLSEFIGIEVGRLDVMNRVNAASNSQVPNDALVTQLRAHLVDVYDYCHLRFGSSLPASWGRQ